MVVKISQKDIEEVIDVLNSDFLTQGPMTVSFENGVKNNKAKRSVTVSSATAATHIACIALDLGPVTYCGRRQSHLSPLPIVDAIAVQK